MLQNPCFQDPWCYSALKPLMIGESKYLKFLLVVCALCSLVIVFYNIYVNKSKTPVIQETSQTNWTPLIFQRTDKFLFFNCTPCPIVGLNHWTSNIHYFSRVAVRILIFVKIPPLFFTKIEIFEKLMIQHFLF